MFSFNFSHAHENQIPVKEPTRKAISNSLNVNNIIADQIIEKKRDRVSIASLNFLKQNENGSVSEVKAEGTARNGV